MLQHDRRIIHSSEESNWRTPKPCYAALDREFAFKWDLASDEESCLVGVVQCDYSLGAQYGRVGPWQPHTFYWSYRT